jgi:hypothetical protein
MRPKRSYKDYLDLFTNKKFKPVRQAADYIIKDFGFHIVSMDVDRFMDHPHVHLEMWIGHAMLTIELSKAHHTEPYDFYIRSTPVSQAANLIARFKINERQAIREWVQRLVDYATQVGEHNHVNNNRRHELIMEGQRDLMKNTIERYYHMRT